MDIHYKSLKFTKSPNHSCQIIQSALEALRKLLVERLILIWCSRTCRKDSRSTYAQPVLCPLIRVPINTLIKITIVLYLSTHWNPMRHKIVFFRELRFQHPPRCGIIFIVQCVPIYKPRSPPSECSNRHDHVI